MSLSLDVRLGSQEPVIQHLPPDVHSLAAAEEAIELADAYLICDGNPLAASQKITIRAALGERADGKWAASRVGDFGPRQGTGKNDKINAVELAGLVLFGERLIIHTAHEFPTANEAFLRMVAIFEAWDDLRRRVARIRYANGEQGIEFLSGQRLKYRARTGGSGRGFAKADRIIYDEAQHLLRSHVAASGPAKLANPNSQSWYAGSGGFSTSAVAWEMRRAAILGTGGRLAFTEMTGETIDVHKGRIVTVAPDPDDREVWYRTIPGLGRWVTEEGVEDMRDELGPDFPREGLCVWDAEPGSESGGTIPSDAWYGCEDVRHRAADQVRYAIDVDVNAKAEEWCSVGASDGVHLEDVTPAGAVAGTGWVVPKLVANEITEVAVCTDGPAARLIDALEAAGITVHKVKSAEFVQATMQMIDACADKTVRHIGQPRLNAAVAGVACRDVGDGNRRFSRKLSHVDISPLVAVTLARWGALTFEDGPSVYEDRDLTSF